MVQFCCIQYLGLNILNAEGMVFANGFDSLRQKIILVINLSLCSYEYDYLHNADVGLGRHRHRSDFEFVD